MLTMLLVLVLTDFGFIFILQALRLAKQLLLFLIILLTLLFNQSFLFANGFKPVYKA